MNRSIAVRQYLNPFEIDNGPTRSMCICSNRFVGPMKVPTGDYVCGPLLFDSEAGSSPFVVILTTHIAE